MTEQMTTPPPKAHIDLQPKKQQLKYQLPDRVSFPVGATPSLLDKSDRFETLRCEGSGVVANSIMSTAKTALERAQADFAIIGESEVAVAAEQANLLKSGHAPVNIVRGPNGALYAVGGRFAELADLSGPLLEKRAAAFDESLTRAQQFRDRLQAEIDASLVFETTARDANLRQDIRNWLIGLGKDAGMAAINAARDGDLSIVHTVLTSPARVIGLSQKDIDMVRDFAGRKQHPTAVDARNEADEVLTIMRSVEKAIATKRNSLTGYKAADKARADDALKKLRSVSK